MDRCGSKLEDGPQCTLNQGHYGAHYSWSSRGVTAWTDETVNGNTKYEGPEIPETSDDESTETSEVDSNQTGGLPAVGGTVYYKL